MKHSSTIFFVIIILVVLVSIEANAQSKLNNNLRQDLVLKCISNPYSGSSIACGYLKTLSAKSIEESNYGIYTGLVPEGSVEPKKDITVQILFYDDKRLKCSEITGKRMAPYEVVFVSSVDTTIKATLKENGKITNLGRYSVTSLGEITFITEDITNGIIIASWDGGTTSLAIEPSTCEEISEENQETTESYDGCADDEDCEFVCEDSCEFVTLCEEGDCSATCGEGDCSIQCVGQDCGTCTATSCDCEGQSCSFTATCHDESCAVQVDGTFLMHGTTSCTGPECYDIEGSKLEGFTICSISSGLCGFTQQEEQILEIISLISQGIPIPKDLGVLTTGPDQDSQQGTLIGSTGPIDSQQGSLGGTSQTDSSGTIVGSTDPSETTPGTLTSGPTGSIDSQTAPLQGSIVSAGMS